MELNNPQPLSSKGNTTDGPVGVAIIILGALALALATYVAVGSWFIFEALGSVFGQNQQGTFMMGEYRPAPQPLNPAYIIFGLLLTICALIIFTGIGVRHGKSWGFNLGIVVFALVILGGNGAAVLGAAIVIYCILRKLGVIGPIPA